tara:strand:+ start:1111 stop:1821 length:711 start_codon:yes stop_codon:yes gene_type:complete
MNAKIKKIEKKLLEKIREHTFNNKELLNAHHFMFACPVNKNGESADIIICGLNPGGDPKEDFRKVYNGEPFPTEESSDYDWWVEDGNQVRSGGAFAKYNAIFGNQKNITHTEAFFWNSTSTGKKDFDDRYGYSFYGNPHWDFCLKMNLELFKAHNPDLILFLTSSRQTVPKIAEMFDLKEIYSFELPRGNRGSTKMYHYEMRSSTPVIFLPHPTGYRPSPEQHEAMKQYLNKVGLI